jgi:inorganic triphosphatase YgiF
MVQRKCEEIEEVRQQMAAMQDENGVTELKTEIAQLKMASKELEQTMAEERKQTAQKLKDKDETISYLMGELARIKMEQSASGLGFASKYLGGGHKGRDDSSVDSDSENLPNRRPSITGRFLGFGS